ncbi:hydantoinase B/oxoprolinase family protein [Acidomonas methanolica]|uniref:hydantoinase B/oxoprolinase family protein n=1 Tax=Acidomonas methanolica TaxID=437 RepID=UPI00211A2869|nr:hydantoinase B/oxoprolinase family protein [Acidomonas methanolica]MCQ9154951.1 hydantoinase B/oxoprolinase family protein [Acidomonas methanolica]
MTNARTALRMDVMWTRLISIVEEQAQTLMRTAFSTTVREAGDLSAAVFDRAGRMIAEAVTGTPGHVNSMAAGVAHFLDRFPHDTMRDGDHFITNDPWLTAGHLHDITVVSPVFHQGRLAGFVGCCCHQLDIGGLGQGPDGRSIFEEGLQIPLMRLARAGIINDDLLAILRANVRTPLQVEGDVMSYIAANRSGAERIGRMMAEFALQDLDALGAHIITRSREATERAIAALPEGSWRAELQLDGYDAPITLRAALHVCGGELVLDYDGTDPVVDRGINVVLNYCRAYSVFGLKTVIAPDVPNNAGALDPFRVVAPEGSILNAPRPCPVAARHVVGQMLPDLVFGCLAQIVPERVPAEGSSCLWSVQLRAMAPGGFETVFFNSGGAGARPGLDGLSGTAFPSGVRAMPVEVIEHGAPVVIWRKEFRPDSAGAGEYRGGFGQRVEVATRDGSPFQVLAMYERARFGARGRNGGGDAAAGAVSLDDGTPMRAKGLQAIPAGRRLVLDVPGGGGWGDPVRRDRDALRADKERGLISSSAAYGEGEWADKT